MSNKRSTNTYKRNTDAVVALARQKSQDTARKVDQAIRELVKSKSVINFNTVAIASGVSKSYLYHSASIRARIESLRSQQKAVSSPKAIHREMSDASKDATIEMLRERNRRLQNENTQLRQQVSRLLGNQYEQIE